MALSLDLNTGKFDREREEWRARMNIGYIMIGLLIAIVVIAFIALFAITLSADDAASSANLTPHSLAAKASGDRLLAVLNIVFAPVATLVGSITGFYFGARTASGAGVGGNTV